MAKKEKKLSANEILVNKTEGWISTHRNVILTAVIVACAAIVVAVVITVISSSKGESSADTALAALEKSYDEYRVMDADAEGYQEKLESVKNDASSLVTSAGTKKYAGAKAELILAEIDFSEGNYGESADKYNAVYEAQKDTYLGQVALMSEASALEESGNESAALEIYNRVFDEYGMNGIFASHALFNVARLTEKDNVELAVSIYEQLIGEFEEGSSEFAKLARSRVSQLKVSK